MRGPQNLPIVSNHRRKVSPLPSPPPFFSFIADTPLLPRSFGIINFIPKTKNFLIYSPSCLQGGFNRALVRQVLIDLADAWCFAAAGACISILIGSLLWIRPWTKFIDLYTRTHPSRYTVAVHAKYVRVHVCTCRRLPPFSRGWNRYANPDERIGGSTRHCLEQWLFSFNVC